MKKIMKVMVVAITMMLSSFAFADDFDWSKCWCNYGGGLKEGDKTLTIDGGMSWGYLNLLNAGWAIPDIVVDFQFAKPIWKLPFTFGGYVGFSSYGVKNWNQKHSNIYSGAEAAYHVMLPPKDLDVYAITRIGLMIDMYKEGANAKANPLFYSHWGEALGASYHFSETFAVNAELGYPVNKVGVQFKF